MYIAVNCCSQIDTVPVMFSVLLYSTVTVQILYSLYSLQLNCTYSNYTEAAATCSAAQQHNTFTVQILYKLYSLQLNCTYSNYTQAPATCPAAQQHRRCQLMSSEVDYSQLFDILCIHKQSHREIRAI